MSEWSVPLVTNLIKSQCGPLDADSALILTLEEYLSLRSPSLIDFHFIDSISPYGALHGGLT